VTSLVATLRGWSLHRSGRVVPWVAAGWFLLSVARLGLGPGLGEVSEILVALLASLLLGVAHQLNRSLAYWHGHSRSAQKPFPRGSSEYCHAAGSGLHAD